jgi:predicted PurR-regulated permease PerM
MAPAVQTTEHATMTDRPDRPSPRPSGTGDDAETPGLQPREDSGQPPVPAAVGSDPIGAYPPPWWRRAVISVIVLVIAAQVGVWAFTNLADFWYTLFFAFFLGLAMEPLVNNLERRGLKRGLGTAVVLGGLLAGSAVFFAVFGNLLLQQLAELIRGFPALIRDAVEWINERFETELSQADVLESLGLDNADLAGYAADLGVGLLGLLGTALGFVFSLFTMLLFAFYFAADGPRLRRTIASWVPPARQRVVLAVWDISIQKAGGYVISRGIMAAISALFHGVLFFLIDLPYWLPMALWVGLVSQFIPTIGTYLAGALPIVLALVEGRLGAALIVLAFVTAYQQFENYYVQPKITQSTLEIHAAVAFGSVIVGGTLFGATGALLAIPVVATVTAVAETYGHRYEVVPELGGHLPSNVTTSPVDRS